MEIKLLKNIGTFRKAITIRKSYNSFITTGKDSSIA